MVAEQSLNLSAQPFGKAHNLCFFGFRGHPLALKLAEDVIAHGSAETACPAVAGNADMHVGAFEHVEYRAGNNLAVPLDPHAGERWDEGNSDCRADELQNPLIRDDVQTTISVISKVTSMRTISASIGTRAPLVTRIAGAMA